MLGQSAVEAPYWVAVLTPEERTFGSRRTDERIDTVSSSVVTETHTQWAAPEHPTSETLLSVLAATVGAWQSDRCRCSFSGVLVDLPCSTVEQDSARYPVRLPVTGAPGTILTEVRRRIAAVPDGGAGYVTARRAPALARKHGAQIAFSFESDAAAIAAPGDDEPLRHNLSVTCSVSELDGVVMVDAEFRWNSRVFTRADVDDFERFWEKTVSAFVRT
jgi:hypothetical protein